MDFLKGFKMMIFGGAVAALPGVLQYLGGVDMDALGLSPHWAAAIGAGIMFLRAYTTTSVFQK